MATTNAESCVSEKPKCYIMQFKGNNSKRWGGKETWIEADILDELYDQTELVHGAEIVVPWRSKGKLTHWKGIFIDATAKSSGRCIYGFIGLLIKQLFRSM